MSEFDGDFVEEGEAPAPPDKSYYFNNETVEGVLYKYLEGSCIDVGIRDKIMTHASELIIQIIRAHNLYSIYPGRDDSSFWDLYQIAWVQIESALYKYDARPHCLYCYNFNRPSESMIVDEFMVFPKLVKKTKKCKRCSNKFLLVGVLEDKRQNSSLNKIYYRGTSKIFNMWSQVARTVILAHIKKESRDRKNSGNLQTHMSTKLKSSPIYIDRFITEAREVFKYNEEHKAILKVISEIHSEDERSYEGLVSKISEKTDLSRAKIVNFFCLVRLMGKHFTDSPINRKVEKVVIPDNGLDNEEDKY